MQVQIAHKKFVLKIALITANVLMVFAIANQASQAKPVKKTIA
jgi:hypothetical protein